MQVLSVLDRVRQFVFGAPKVYIDDSDDMPQSAPIPTGILKKFMAWMGYQNRPAITDGPETPPRMMVLVPLATSTPDEGAVREFVLVEEVSPINGQLDHWFEEGSPPELWNASDNAPEDPAPSENLTPVRRRRRNRLFRRTPTPFPTKDQKRARIDSM